MNDEIGESAGNLWGKLVDNGPLTIKQLKLKTGLDTELLTMGLGWLAR